MFLIHFFPQKKQDSPSAKPANQWGSKIFINSILGLIFGIILGKFSFKLSGKPKFKEARRLLRRRLARGHLRWPLALILRISKRPLFVKCSLRSIKSIISLNNKKSALFCVSKGYFSKWAITYSAKSLIDLTRKKTTFDSSCK